MTDLTRRRPSGALIVAILALVVALGGTTYAAVKLPKDSVTSKQVKNGSLKAKDVKPGQLGRVVTHATIGTPVTITATGVDRTLVRSLTLPKGTFQVTATVYVINDSLAQRAEPRCFLESTGTFLARGLTGFYTNLPVSPSVNHEVRDQFQLEATIKAKKGSTVRVECNEDAAPQDFRVGTSLTAMQVHSTQVQP